MTKQKKTKAQPKRKQQRKKKQPPAKRVRFALPFQPRLSECATHYALASYDPFTTIGGACVPDNKTVPSNKFKWIERGTCLAGDTWGFVTLALTAPVASATYGNYSGTSFANAGTDGWADADTGVSEPTFPATLPNAITIASSDTPLGSQWRMVAAGLRIRYIGTQDQLGGQYYLHSSTNNNTMYNDTITFNDIVSSQNTRVEVVDRNWHTICWTPKQQSDFDYSESAYYPANSSRMEPIVIAFMSTDANQFAWEMVWHWEVVNNTATNQSPSDSDPIGLAAVTSARSKMAARRTRPSVKGFFTEIYGALRSSFSSTAPAMAGMAANYLAPGSGGAASSLTRSMMGMSM